ncbi:MAG: hypothetical protein DYG86_02960 [Chloroflexi bacterium CFX2]|nr:hypothetical protein [Chloroflexi bacterium CFX2]
MSRAHLILALCLASLACSSQIIPIPTETPTATPSPTQTPTTTPTLEPTLTTTPAPPARRVLILSIDGFRPDAKHKVDWNDYIPDNGYAQVTDLFDIAHQAGMQTAMYVGKEKLRQITEPQSTDIFKFINDRDLVITEDLIQNFPADFRLMFVHFPTTDWMGHEYGWLSPEQLSVLFRADQAIERLVTELNNRGLHDETLFIVTADHGGHDTTHGSSLPEDMTIPWIASGAGVQPAPLNSPITTVDTASTAAFALGLPIPPEWDGVPVYEAFGLPIEKVSVGCSR